MNNLRQHSFYNHSDHNYGIYIVNEWNINGFKSLTSPHNIILKQNIIGSLYADFWILPETHAKTDKEIDLENFTVFQHERLETRRNRGSGGLTFAVNKTILELHEILSIVKGIDGQLGIKLRYISTQTYLWV